MSTEWNDAQARKKLWEITIRSGMVTSLILVFGFCVAVLSRAGHTHWLVTIGHPNFLYGSSALDSGATRWDASSCEAKVLTYPNFISLWPSDYPSRVNKMLPTVSLYPLMHGFRHNRSFSFSLSFTSWFLSLMIRTSDKLALPTALKCIDLLSGKVVSDSVRILKHLKANFW